MSNNSSFLLHPQRIYLKRCQALVHGIGPVPLQTSIAVHASVFAHAQSVNVLYNKPRSQALRPKGSGTTAGPALAGPLFAVR